MSPKPKNKPTEEAPREGAAGPLVPLYSPGDIVPGIQAFRRGDAILYTVRGEPAEALELMDQLAEEGVDEVVALISHRALEPQDEQDEPREKEAKARVKPSEPPAEDQPSA